jgi:hypothetical protein
MKYTDPNLPKILSLLAHSKEALDKVCEAADAYADCDADLKWARECLQEEVDGLATGEEWADEDSVQKAKADLEKIEAKHILLAAELATLAKSLEDGLGSAGRVSDHFNKKTYPLGMSPL